MRTSYSALDTFRQCPQKFKFQIIDKIKAPKTPEAVFGSSVHGALKFMFSRDPLYPTLEEVMANFSLNWNESVKKSAFDKNLADVYETSGCAMLKKFYSANPPWNFSVIDTESRFEVPMPSPEGEIHVLAGIIDRVDKIGEGEYEIIDYKTNRRLPSQSAADENLQMSIYHMALMRKWPNTNPAKIKLSLYFLKHEEKISSFRAADALAATSEAILKTIKEIQKNLKDNAWKPVPSPLCDWCAYKPICPAWKHLYKPRAEFPAPDETQLQAVLQEYFAIKENEGKSEKRLKELQTTIKAYMDAHEIERVFDERGYFVAKKLQQRFKYDFDKVREILLGAGLEDKWNTILEADEKKLKEIMLTLPSPIRDRILAQKSLSKEFVVLTASTKPPKK